MAGFQLIKWPSLEARREYMFWKSVDNERVPFERKWTEPLYRVLSACGAKIASAIARGESAEGATSVAKMHGNLLAPLEEVYSDMFYDVELHFGRTTLQHFVGKSIRPAETKATGDPWDEWDPNQSAEMMEWNRTVTGINIRNVADSVKARVRKITADALASGKDNAAIAQLLQASYGFSRDRATRIVQTEVNSAQNAASFFAMKKFVDDGSLLKTWLATRDRRTRPSHAAANGQVQPMDDSFSVGSAKLLFPGDISQGAPGREVIRCRCTVTYSRDPSVAYSRDPNKPPATAPVSIPDTGVQGSRVDNEQFTTVRTRYSPERMQKVLDVLDWQNLPEVLRSNKVLELRLEGVGSGSVFEVMNGSYKNSTRQMWLSERPATFYPSPKLVPGQTWSIGSTKATSALEGQQQTLIHETGHHLMNVLTGKQSTLPNGAEVYQSIGKAYTSAMRSGGAITKYGSSNKEEYFAETFAAYMQYPDTLASFDPTGYKMMTSVLKGLKVIK